MNSRLDSFSCPTIRLLAVSCVFCCALCPSSPAAEAKKNAGHDLIFLADSRPVLVRVHVLVDGKPIEDVWNGFIDELFKKLDTDKDGVLNRAEAARIPMPQELFAVNNPFLRFQQGFALTTVDANRDGKVTRDELADYYRNNGGTPFNLVRAAGNNEMSRRVAFDFYGQAQTPGGAEALNKALFAALDTDKDGKLSRAELAAAATVLLKKDLDDDEMITSAELRGEAPMNLGYQVVFTGGDPTMPLTDGPLMQVNARDSGFGRNLAKTLLSRYARTAERKKEGKLTAKDLGLDAATFQKLDADGDGKLDQEELARFARRDPDLDVTVALGGKEGVEVRKVEGRGDFPGVKKGSNGSLLLQAGNTLLQLGFNGRQQWPLVRPPVRDEESFIKMQFANADTDGNGYLDEMEVRRSPFAGTFKAMDADGDGKLYLKEVLAFLAARKELRDKANAACVTLTLSDEGKGLFDMLDTNNDGRLSVRELRNAPQLLARLDQNGDGALSPNEVPRRFQLLARRGPSNNNNQTGLIAVAPEAYGVPQTTPQARGPLWFRKMDRNHDGDVSRREFLGTDEQFRAIDTDGDGLISLQEAEAYDRKMRDRK